MCDLSDHPEISGKLTDVAHNKTDVGHNKVDAFAVKIGVKRDFCRKAKVQVKAIFLHQTLGCEMI